jgi:hypothetical protein
MALWAWPYADGPGLGATEADSRVWAVSGALLALAGIVLIGWGLRNASEPAGGSAAELDADEGDHESARIERQQPLNPRWGRRVAASSRVRNG